MALADDGQLRSVVVNFGTSTSLVPRVREGVRSRFTLSLDRNPLRRVTIPLKVTHRGGATAADYEGIPASVTFGPRERQADFIMRAVLDQQDETGEGLRIDFGPLPPGVRKGTWGPYETGRVRGHGPGGGDPVGVGDGADGGLPEGAQWGLDAVAAGLRRVGGGGSPPVPGSPTPPSATAPARR